VINETNVYFNSDLEAKAND